MPPFSIKISTFFKFCIYYIRKHMNRSSTEMIAWFTSAKLQMELNQDKSRLRKATDVIDKRRQKLSKRQNAIVKQKKNMNQAIAQAESFKVMDDHRITMSQFCQRYETDSKNGLTEAEAQKRLQLYGQNRLSAKQKRHWILDYLHGMANFFCILLWLGAVLCFIAYGVFPSDPSNLYLGIVLVAIIFIGTTVEFIQNRKSQAIMDSFKDFVPPQTIVIRQGKQRSLSALKIVKGDLIKIQTGKKIPADIRIVESNGMKVDNSSLTGQTQLLSRTSECTRPDNAFETKNIAFFSTLNKQGSGLGIVMFTGDKTFIGQIAGLAIGAEQVPTPLQVQIDRFVFRLGVFAIVMGIIVFVVGILIGFQIITALTLAIGITVANVPNGLLLQVTIALTLTAKRLAKKKVLAKNLQAVETLGSTTCVCSDKTGTLTQNKMTAAHLWYSGKILKASNQQKEGKQFHYEYKKDSSEFKILQEAATICSVATFDKSPPSAQITYIQNNQALSKEEKTIHINKFKAQWQEKLKTMRYLDMNTLGDASESALIKFFQPIQDIVQVRNRYPIIKNAQGRDCRLLFDSKNKFAYSINKYKTQGSDLCLFTKGAPQKVWKMCTHLYQNGVRIPKTPQWEKRFKQANQFFGKAGQRVLGFAKLHLDNKIYTETYPYRIDDVQTPNVPLFQQTFAGIVSLNDPPRDSVPFSVTKCQAAGVQVIMVTGDQPVTATAIARQCNIIKSEFTVNQIMEKQYITFDQAFLQSQAIVIHGDQLTKMSLEDQGKPQAEQGKRLQKWLHKKQIVFARTSPAQKLIIVKACQKLGHVVAVTGDGVNDSPAIKKADLGISMGISGTDVAKDAADMILLNDDFSSIVMGIQEGRKIFDNLKKAITYVMISQVSQIAPFIGLLIIQYPVPVSTVVLLCIDLGTDLIPAIAYAYQPSQIGIMTRKPRNSQDHLVTMRLMGQGYGWMGWSSFFASLLAFFICMNDFGFVVTDMPFKNGIFLLENNMSDIYNPSSKTFGNTNLQGFTKCSQFQNKKILIDWLYSKKPWLDLRMSAVTCDQYSGTPVFSQIFKIGQCRIQQISPISNAPVCFTTQAGKYGQSAYFYANVISQIFNFFLCKTRKQSIFTQGMDNPVGYFGLTTECMIMFGLAFIQPLNVVFGTRDCIFMHFGIIAIPFGFLRLILDQIRKYLMRVLPPGDFGKPNYLIRISLW